MSMLSSLHDLVALVTGASQGIGEAIARRLAQKGMRVIGSARTLNRLEAAMARLVQNGGEAVGIPCDLADPAATARLAHEACRLYGRLDVLINNAGAPLKKPFHECTDAEWMHVLAVNSMAPFILCRELLPALQKSPHATIIQIGSVMGIKGYEHQSVYAASKHALMGFTKVMAQELQSHNIRVHTINPGGVNTALVQTMRPDLDPAGLIQPEDIAEMVLFLLEHRGQAVIDDIHVRRASSAPWY